MVIDEQVCLKPELNPPTTRVFNHCGTVLDVRSHQSHQLISQQSEINKDLPLKALLICIENVLI